MSNSIQVNPMAPAAPRPAVKRVSAPVAPPAAMPLDDKAQAKVESAQPVEPVVAVQPSTHLTIAKDEAANTFVYRSIDSKTGDVVWQYPVEQVLRMAHTLRELEGLDEHKVDQKV